MHQPHHAVRDGDCDAGGHQGALTWRKLDGLGAVKVESGVTVVGATGQRKAGIQAHNRQTGRHGATDYP